MAGCLDLNTQSLFKADKMDSTLGFSDGNSTQASRGRPTFMQQGRKNTFASNLDIFKVSRSDYEDSDNFDESDEEMLFDMENILKHSKKFNSKSTSFENFSMEFNMENGKKDSKQRNHGLLRPNKSFHQDTTQTQLSHKRKRKTSFQSQKINPKTKNSSKDDDTESSQNQLSSIKIEND